MVIVVSDEPHPGSLDWLSDMNELGSNRKRSRSGTGRITIRMQDCQRPHVKTDGDIQKDGRRARGKMNAMMDGINAPGDETDGETQRMRTSRYLLKATQGGLCSQQVEFILRNTTFGR